jgi:transcriptional regulator with XRE-family HTH domain
MTPVSFEEWLTARLAERGLKPFHLAKEAGVAASTILNLLSGERRLGTDVARAIAKALDLPQWEVFLAAGLMTETPISDGKRLDPLRGRLFHLVDQVAPEDIRLAIQLLEVVNRVRSTATKRV